MCHVSHTEPCNRSSSGVIGLLVALFVHSLLEGLAIGLQETVSQVIYICMHYLTRESHLIVSNHAAYDAIRNLCFTEDIITAILEKNA